MVSLASEPCQVTTSRNEGTRGRLLVQEPEVEVEAAGQASKAQGKLLVQELEPAETALEVNVEAVEQDSRSLVVVLTMAQAGLWPILQEQILRQMI